jgi:hypothetical protein
MQLFEESHLCTPNWNKGTSWDPAWLDWICATVDEEGGQNANVFVRGERLDEPASVNETTGAANQQEGLGCDARANRESAKVDDAVQARLAPTLVANDACFVLVEERWKIKNASEWTTPGEEQASKSPGLYVAFVRDEWNNWCHGNVLDHAVALLEPTIE